MRGAPFGVHKHVQMGGYAGDCACVVSAFVYGRI